MNRKPDPVRVLVAVLAISCLAAGIASGATVASAFTYQGTLANPSGDSLTGTYSVMFRIYDVSTGGTALSTDTHSVVVTAGLFTTEVAITDPSVMDGRALWLGIKVGSDPEMTPRQEIGPVPYALSLRPGALISGEIPGNSIVHLINTAPGSAGLMGQTTGYASAGVAGMAQGLMSNGLYGESADDAGIYGIGKEGGYFTTNSAGPTYSDLHPGLNVSTSFRYNPGVLVHTYGDQSPGVYSSTTGTGSEGVLAITTGYGTRGVKTITTGDSAAGLYSTTRGPNSEGLYASTEGTNSYGGYIHTEGSSSHGIWARTEGDGSAGFLADTGGSNSDGVRASVTGAGSRGIVGISSQSEGVYGEATGAAGVHGFSVNKAGVWGMSTNDVGVYGYAPDNSGILGRSTNKAGVRGESTYDAGVYGSSAVTKGVYGSGNPGVYGESTTGGAGIIAQSSGGGTGLVATGGTDSGNRGVWAHANNQGTAVVASVDSGTGTGIAAFAGPYGGNAGEFYGNVQIRKKESPFTVLLELGEGLDYSEGFDIAGKDTVAPGTVLVISPDDPGTLTVSSEPYDSKVAGIVAGANGIGSAVKVGGNEFDANVALAGRVYCNVDATYGAVEPGSQLTTSPTPGYAMVVQDRDRATGAILGKAMERLEAGRKGQVLVLVTLQ